MSTRLPPETTVPDVGSPVVCDPLRTGSRIVAEVLERRPRTDRPVPDLLVEFDGSRYTISPEHLGEMHTVPR